MTQTLPSGGRLPRPVYSDQGPELWIDEAIWGHRLYDDQTPWLTLLECLGVVAAEHRENRAFAEPADRRLVYTPLVQLRLRNILFNSPQLTLLATRGGGDEECWRVWLEGMQVGSGGLSTPDYSYLRRHFQSFQDFAAVVEFLRASTIEGPNNKRWSSQFLFPFGTSALYEDLSVSKASYSYDRRFFARTGELLYLMLARSGRGQEIRVALEARLLGRSLPYARLVSALQGQDEQTKSPKAGAYLPYAELPEYRKLADDWLSVLGSALPGYDVLPHLATLSGLHLLLYLLRRSCAEVGRSDEPTFVLEIVSPRKTIVRDISAESYAENNRLPQEALAAHIDSARGTPEWIDAVDSADPLPRVKEVLYQRFGWPDEHRDGDEVLGCATPDELVAALQRRALTRHRAHLAKIHGAWGRAIGLSSRRSSRSTRYAPTDALLKTLVICCVGERMEFNEWIALLRSRYGFVIGPREAAEHSLATRADAETFDDNLIRLEQRLTSLGLVKRLSDQCAYLQNPFANPTSR
jgi:hypothetical protein